MSHQAPSPTGAGAPATGLPSRHRIWSWTALGAGFVVASWALAAAGAAWPGSLGSLHRQNPAYFLIDLAPLVLFLMARASMRLDLEPERVSRREEVPLPPAASPAKTEVVASPATAFRVLVTDDNAVNRRVATLILRKAGHEVVEAADGREAVQRVLEGTFDLVLMDVQMPVMDGLEATRILRGREDGTRRLPIVAMTAQTMAGDAQACVEAGMDGYVSKPVKPITLLAAVESWARQERAPAGAAKSEAPIDPATLRELRTYGGECPDGILEELTVMFLDGAARHLAVMRDAVRRDDAETLEQVAHTLKGSSATLGAKRLADLCFGLEDDARQGKVPTDESVLDRVEAEIDTVREYMGREVGLPV